MAVYLHSLYLILICVFDARNNGYDYKTSLNSRKQKGAFDENQYRFFVTNNTRECSRYCYVVIHCLEEIWSSTYNSPISSERSVREQEISRDLKRRFQQMKRQTSLNGWKIWHAKAFQLTQNNTKIKKAQNKCNLFKILTFITLQIIIIISSKLPRYALALA